MRPDIDVLAAHILAAEELFLRGEFTESYHLAHDLLDAVDAAHPVDETWRAQLLGLIGQSALHISRLDESFSATGEALQRVEALNDAALDSLREKYRETLLTVIAALESPKVVGDGSPPVAHRTCRRGIVRAQTLTDRFRFAESINVLQPLYDGLSPLFIAAGDPPPTERPDVRVWYLPRVAGLLGFNWFHLGDRARAAMLTVEALDASQAFGDRTGQRTYEANLARI